jgi:hypothetical protein
MDLSKNREASLAVYHERQHPGVHCRSRSLRSLFDLRACLKMAGPYRQKSAAPDRHWSIQKHSRKGQPSLLAAEDWCGVALTHRPDAPARLWLQAKILATSQLEYYRLLAIDRCDAQNGRLAGN